MDLLPESVIITDDTMREGLQIEDANIPVKENCGYSTHLVKQAPKSYP